MSEVIGSIPPGQFNFQNVVPLREPGPGGWKAAQVIVLLGSRYGAVTCKVEVGVPEMNGSGVVTTGSAQLAAAESANAAARMVLRATHLSAHVCRAFIDEMNMEMKRRIDGATVSTFVSSHLTPTTWP
jgi:hypothetical protein